jgi:hypothetical protein
MYINIIYKRSMILWKISLKKNISENKHASSIIHTKHALNYKHVDCGLRVQLNVYDTNCVRNLSCYCATELVVAAENLPWVYSNLLCGNFSSVTAHSCKCYTLGD